MPAWEETGEVSRLRCAPGSSQAGRGHSRRFGAFGQRLFADMARIETDFADHHRPQDTGVLVGYGQSQPWDFPFPVSD